MKCVLIFVVLMAGGCKLFKFQDGGSHLLNVWSMDVPVSGELDPFLSLPQESHTLAHFNPSRGHSVILEVLTGQPAKEFVDRVNRFHAQLLEVEPELEKVPDILGGANRFQELLNRVKSMSAKYSSWLENGDHIIRIYFPGVSIKVRHKVSGTSAAIDVAIPNVIHLDFGIQTMRLKESISDKQVANIFERALVWCQDLCEKIGSQQIGGLKAGVNIGSSTFAKGSFAVGWATSGLDEFGKLLPGATQLHSNVSFLSGLATITGGLSIAKDGEVILKLPKIGNPPELEKWLRSMVNDIGSSIVSSVISTEVGPIDGLTDPYSAYVGNIDGSSNFDIFDAEIEPDFAASHANQIEPDGIEMTKRTKVYLQFDEEICSVSGGKGGYLRDTTF